MNALGVLLGPIPQLDCHPGEGRGLSPDLKMDPGLRRDDSR